MNSIDLAPYEEHFPETGSVRINHCKEGDSNRKFYLTRVEGGGVVGYCHHCCQSGFYRPSVAQRRISGRTSHCQPDSADPFKRWGVPELAKWETCDRWETVPFGDLPLLTRKWWFSNGLNVSEYEAAGIKLLDGNRLTIPLSGDNKSITGLAIRPLKDNLPKWILLGSKLVAPFTQVETPPDTLVLTEDYCSALRISRSYATLPLMGTSLNSNGFSLITKWYKEGRRVLVWLDNDSQAVVHRAKDIRKQLSPFVDCGIILLKKEPKHFIHDSEIREVIHGT